MGDVSVIARRMKDGRIQHGWGGNWGYPSRVGAELMYYYTDPEAVDYLLSLGQLRRLGAPGDGDHSCILTGQEHWVSGSERGIFTKIAFIDHAYFYDADEQWYYIMPWPFCIKYPLRLVTNTSARDCEDAAGDRILEYIFEEYPKGDKEFAALIEEDYKDAYERLKEEDYDRLCALNRHYPEIIDHFDRWIVAESDPDFREVTRVLMRRRTKEHVETISWNDAWKKEKREPGRYRNRYVRDYTLGAFEGYLSGCMEVLDKAGYSAGAIVEDLSGDAPEGFIRQFVDIGVGEDGDAERERFALMETYEEALWADERSAKKLEYWRGKAEQSFRDAIRIQK